MSVLFLPSPEEDGGGGPPAEERVVEGAKGRGAGGCCGRPLRHALCGPRHLPILFGMWEENQTAQASAISARSSARPVPFSAEVAMTRGKAAGRRATAASVRAVTASTSPGAILSALVSTIW